MFPADRGDLRVERQVATRVRFPGHRCQHLEEPGFRPQNATSRRRDDPLEELDGLFQRRGGVEGVGRYGDLDSLLLGGIVWGGEPLRIFCKRSILY